VRRRLDGVVEEADGRGVAGMRDGGVGDRRPRGLGRRAGGWRQPRQVGPTCRRLREREREAGAGGPSLAETGMGRGWN
jgi:hypothetical protein